jgi:hypothetical protein
MRSFSSVSDPGDFSPDPYLTLTASVSSNTGIAGTRPGIKNVPVVKSTGSVAAHELDLIGGAGSRAIKKYDSGSDFDVEL